jgi:hypothetical protein
MLVLLVLPLSDVTPSVSNRCHAGCILDQPFFLPGSAEGINNRFYFYLSKSK